MNLRPYLDIAAPRRPRGPGAGAGRTRARLRRRGPARGSSCGSPRSLVERRLAGDEDLRRRIGLGVFYGMARVWVLAGTIIVLGLAASRADGLTAALVIFGAFSMFFAGSAIAHVTSEEDDLMSTRRKITFGILGVYVVGLIAIVVIFGAARKDNPYDFEPAERVQARPWVNLPGPFDINKGVLYLFIATTLTIGIMLYISKRMQGRPNRVQTAVEWAYTGMRDKIVARQHGRRDGEEVVPARLHAVRLHLDLEPHRLPAAAGELREHGQHLRRCTCPRSRSTPRPRTSRSRSSSRSSCSSPTTSRASGPRASCGYIKSMIPPGLSRADPDHDLPAGDRCRTSCGSSR